MKKKAKRLISALLAATVVLGVGVGASGCGKSKKEESGLYVRRDGKKYDSSKTQINVYFTKRATARTGYTITKRLSRRRTQTFLSKRARRACRYGMRAICRVGPRRR